VNELPAPLEIPGATHLHSGKVRDLYTLEDGNLLMVASDRISAYDFILDPVIPEKGAILTRMSLWWFDQLAAVIPNHVISDEVPEIVAGRALIVEPLDMFPVECVARGYLTGSGLSDYRETGQVCGIDLPAGLVDGSKLPAPIFTPASKAEFGDHDENITFADVETAVGEPTAAALRELTLSIYELAEGIAREQGIILADTKFEFGSRADGVIVLADEVLTPDSSRFWPVEDYEPGRAQPSFDKQIVRNWLTSPESGWDKASNTQPPALPEAVIERTRARYIEAYERLTGETW